PVGPTIGPAPEQGLDEPLRLAVGLRRVGPREDLPDAAGFAKPAEGTRAVALGVVREDPLGPDAETREPTQRALEEGRGTRSVLSGQDLGVGQARVVIDANEDRLPACALAAPAAIAVDPVPDPLDPPELLRIDVQEATGLLVLVALRRLLGLAHAPQPPQAQAAEDPRHRGARQAQLAGDLPGRLAPASQTVNRLHEACGDPPRRRARPGGPIEQTRLSGFLEPLQPLMRGSPAHTGRLRGLLHEPALAADPVHQQPASRRRQPRVRMNRHSGSPL